MPETYAPGSLIVTPEGENIIQTVGDALGDYLHRMGFPPALVDSLRVYGLAAAAVEVVAPLIETAVRLRVAREIDCMPNTLGDAGWAALADQAWEASYPRQWVTDRRRRDDFTTATIETAYQYGYRCARDIARGGAS